MDRAHLHLHGAADALEEDILNEGENIRPLARQKAPVLVAVDVGGDAGVHPSAHHVQPQLSVAVHQVKLGLGPLGQGLQVVKDGPVVRAKNFQEIVSRPLGDAGDGGVWKARRPVDHFI